MYRYSVNIICYDDEQIQKLQLFCRENNIIIDGYSAEMDYYDVIGYTQSYPRTIKKEIAPIEISWLE